MNKNISRRRFLQSGAAIAAMGQLPLWSLLSNQAMAATTDKKRVIFWYVPEGCAQQAFWPSHAPGPLNINMSASIDGKNPQSRGNPFQNYKNNGDNADGSMGSYCLQPLKAHEKDMSVISGFHNNGSNLSGAQHKNVISTALTGGTPEQGSIDQIIGPMMQGDARLASLFSSVYGEHIRVGIGADFASPFRHVGGKQGSLSWNPVTTYNRAFPNGIQTGVPGGVAEFDHRLHSRLEVINSLESRLKDVRCIGGSLSADKLESYLDSLTRLETETQSIIDTAPPEALIDVGVDIPNGWDNTIKPSGQTPYWHDPSNFARMVKIQIDTTVAALALDQSRVSLLQFSATGTSAGISGKHYESCGIAGLEGATQDHHLGHDPNSIRRRDQARVFRWYYSQLSYLVDRLKSIPEGSGSLFDNTLIVCCSEFSMFNHRSNDMPYMLLGNPGGAFKMGQFINASSNGKRNHAEFFLGVTQGLGLDLNSFGNTSSAYQGILT